MTPILGTKDFAAERDLLLQRASTFAGALSQAATSATTLGRERAILRLLGVTGLDHEGRPLAAAVVDRYVAGDAARLATGIGLPFAVALLEYDSNPQQLALDVAAGSVDLALEAQLLDAPDRRAAAEGHLLQLATAAVDRIDANRVARTELLEALGDRRPPWIAATLSESLLVQGALEASELIRAGLDLVRVEVPAIRELAIRLGELGMDVAGPPQRAGDDPETTPVGSQRGLARLRDVLDQAAAERGAYVRLAIAPSALAGSEGAIVAAFERADVIELDPMRDMFVTGVDAERALVDFAFAARVTRRAGVALLLDAGPLVVAPDMDSGINADPATRSGRSLVLQLLTVLVARASGVADQQLIVGAIPEWLAGEPEATALAVAEVALRRALFPSHPLAFVEPADSDGSGRWAAIVAAVQPGSNVALILPRIGSDPDQTAAAAARTRWAAETAERLEGEIDGSRLAGTARDHAGRALASAIATLDQLERDGWPALTGATTSMGGWGWLGAGTVAPNGHPADPVERALSG